MKPLTAAERKKLQTLQRKWATRRATARDIEQCQSLERRDRAPQPPTPRRRMCKAWPQCACVVRGAVADCPPKGLW